MSALTRFERFDDLFPEMFRRLARPMQFGIEPAPAEIRVDVTENEKGYLVTAEIPGAKKDDIRVVVDGNYVSIAADIKKDREDRAENGKVLVKETYRGTISRGFTLAHAIDDKATTAKLEDGVLKLTLPKQTSASSKLIPVT